MPSRGLCNALAQEIDGMAMKGARFGRLTVTWADSHRDEQDEVCWRCRCDCGAEIVVRARDLKSNRIRSCGCSSSQRLVLYESARRTNRR
jgi:hypothetical protein